MPEDELPVRHRHFVVEVDSGLCREETVCAHSREHVHQKVMDASVTCMDKLCHVFEHIVDRSDNASFAQHNFILLSDKTNMNYVKN